MGRVLSYGTSNGRFVGGYRSMVRCGYGFYTDEDVNKILDQVGSTGKDHNMIMSLRFIIIECFCWPKYM